MFCLNSYPTEIVWTWIILLVALWTMPWKGVALWRAAGNKHLWWFVALFVLNTLAILEIIYIFGFSRRKSAAA
ncbi:MAG: hypothetical protein FJ023_02530 [Chloroflexi bacterium]|nr:hypothetical protein [Chloroflexota bacterium]